VSEHSQRALFTKQLDDQIEGSRWRQQRQQSDPEQLGGRK
jgi:hypothetical protein